MAHIQSKLLKLWKPQNLSVDKISSQKMFIDNVDLLESFGLSVLKRTDVPVASIDELRAVDTSDTSLYTDGMMIMVKSNGLYFFNRSSEEDDDGKNIIAPTNGGGRWISDFSFLGSVAFKDSLSASDVGLGNVPNVATNDQTPTYIQASSLVNIASGEKLSVSMGKIMKAIADLISHISDKTNPHGVTKLQVGLGNVDNTSDMDKPVSTAQQNAINAAASNGSTALTNLNNHIADADIHLPAVTTDDNDKILKVVNGAWTTVNNLSIVSTTTLLASDWYSTCLYSFEIDYPSSIYDIEVALDSTATTAQAEAFNGAQIVGSATSNIIKAYGEVPTIDIPIILKVVKK